MRQTTETRDAARHRHPRDRQQACVPKGLSLVEVVISTLLVGLLAVEAMRSVGAVFQSRAATAKGLDGIGLSHHLISEVVQSHYEDPDETPAFGREPGEAQTLSNRADFDDVDDYHGWSSTSLQLEDGTPIAGYAGWRRDVTITFADPDNPTGNSSSDLDLKRITVTVTDPDNTQTVLVAFRSRWGLLEQEPPLGRVFDHWNRWGAANRQQRCESDLGNENCQPRRRPIGNSCEGDPPILSAGHFTDRTLGMATSMWPS